MVDIVPPLRAEPPFDAFGQFTIRYSEYFERVAEVSNENTSDVDIFSGVNLSSSVNSQLLKRINDLELLLNLSPDLSGILRELSVVETAVNYTTKGNEIIICTNASGVQITITLRATPNDRERIHIIRKDGAVSFISSAGVNGSTTAFTILDRKGAPSLIFTNEAAEYSII